MIKVGIGVKSDLIKLEQDFNLPNGSLSIFIDPSYTASRIIKDISKTGMKHLSNFFLGFDISKSKKLARSDWDKSLTPKQIEYAAYDALVPFLIFSKMHNLRYFDYIWKMDGSIEDAIDYAMSCDGRSGFKKGKSSSAQSHFENWCI